jgi:hypothetical protein
MGTFTPIENWNNREGLGKRHFIGLKFADNVTVSATPHFASSDLLFG